MTSFASCGPAREHSAGRMVPAVTRPKSQGGRKATFQRNHVLGEGLMKRQGRSRRHFPATTDGTLRWDQAYQPLLEWAQSSAPSNGVPLLASPPAPGQEE